MSTVLSVNLNKIALIRNSRGRDFPNVVDFGRLALEAGAKGVTIHPRQDQRHARYTDVDALMNLTLAHPGTELNVEGYPSDEFLEVVLAAKPHQCTLVPDDPNQITSDHGWNIEKDGEQLKTILQVLKDANIRSCLFMDPEPSHMAGVADLGAERIELYTESYAEAFGREGLDAVLNQYRLCAEEAAAVGLGVNAGHDLNLDNLKAFLDTVPNILEVSIGHALTVESLHYGWVDTVKKYARLCSE